MRERETEAKRDAEVTPLIQGAQVSCYTREVWDTAWGEDKHGFEQSVPGQEGCILPCRKGESARQDQEGKTCAELTLIESSAGRERGKGTGGRGAA